MNKLNHLSMCLMSIYHRCRSQMPCELGPEVLRSQFHLFDFSMNLSIDRGLLAGRQDQQIKHDTACLREARAHRSGWPCLGLG